MLREPLLHFALIGALLATLAGAYRSAHDVRRIVVTPGRVAQIARKYVLQFGAPPDPATLDRLVRTDIHDEILFRQGLALKLDRDDEIVRRRVVQKEEFLIQGAQAPPEPTPAQLQAYAAAHPDRYVEPARASFTHVFFAAGPDGEVRARAALAKTPASAVRAPGAGDPFPDLYDFSAFEPEQVARLFGHTPFAQAVFTALVGRWTGPFRSAYGWHLLRVGGRTPSRRLPLGEIAERVRADVVQEAQDRADHAAFDRVARRYTVVRADKGTAP